MAVLALPVSMRDPVHLDLAVILTKLQNTVRCWLVG